jgi:hypothetical protein
MKLSRHRAVVQSTIRAHQLSLCAYSSWAQFGIRKSGWRRTLINGDARLVPRVCVKFALIHQQLDALCSRAQWRSLQWVDRIYSITPQTEACTSFEAVFSLPTVSRRRRCSLSAARFIAAASTARL